MQVLFGTGPGIDTSAFINAYIAPAASVPGIDTTPELISFMEQFDEGAGVDTGLVANAPVVTLTAGQAWSQFQALPLRVQQLFAEDVLFNVLQTVGNDFNNPASPFFHQYERGYQAINTLFPASFGYTANNLDGGDERRQQVVTTGNLDMRSRPSRPSRVATSRSSARAARARRQRIAAVTSTRRRSIGPAPRAS